MTILGVILAGGTGERVGGRDKAALALGGAPLIRHVHDRLAPQVDAVLVNSASDYGLALPVAPDPAGGVEGPAAGLAAALTWAEARPQLAITAIATVPVDGPFLPRDLVARLSAAGGPAVAATEDGLQPTFGFWPLAALDGCRALLGQPGGLAMAALVDAAGAQRVAFQEARGFMNVNRPEDLERAERLLAAGAL